MAENNSGLIKLNSLTERQQTTTIIQPSYDTLCDRFYLETAADLALRSGDGTITRQKQAFLDNREKRMIELMHMMQTQSYTFSELHQKIIYEPKKRIIDVPDFFPDRIIERAATDLIKPLIIDSLVRNTYGSIKGRGLHDCAAQIKMAVALAGPNAYFVKIDAKHYYESIDHDRLKRILRDLLEDDRLYDLFCGIIDAHKKGLAIGVYPSQYLANLYLSIVDWAMIEGYGFKYYFRYMDDIVIILPNKQEANRALDILKYLFALIKLTIKNNERVAPLAYGIDFCGYVFYPTHTALRKSIKLRAQRKARLLDKMGVSDEVWKQQMAAYYGWFVHADCAHLWLSLVKNRHIHYKNKMKTLAEIKESLSGMFDLPKSQFVPINELANTEIVVEDTKILPPFDQDDDKRQHDRIAIKFAYLDQSGEHYTISGSIAVVERLSRYKEHLPFTLKIVERVSARKKTYYCIE